MVFLIPCSLLAVAYIIQGFINLRRNKLLPPDLVNRALNIKTQADLKSIETEVQRVDSLFSRIMRRLLLSRQQKIQPAESLDDIIEDEISRLYQRNSQLAVIYTVAPLLGLLGTIIGMMKAFHLFSAMSNPSVTQLGRGIDEALITTMWGLFIAIPSFVVLSLFRYRLFSYEREIIPLLMEKIMANIEAAANRETEGEPDIEDTQE